MAMDNASRMKAIRKAIKILQESGNKNKNKNRTVDANEMNYVIETLKDKENQLRMEQDEPTGTA